MACAAWTSGATADEDLYTVRAVPVDATADTATAARERAVAEGRRAAFADLMVRLVPRSRLAEVPDPTDSELQQMTLGFEVGNERTSAVRYLADLTVAFDESAVRGLLRRSGIPFSETRSLPVLVVPLFDTGGDTRLWEEPNPWRLAWESAPPAKGLVPFVVPFGDIADIRDLSLEQALAGDRTALDRIAERYGARDTVVARATPRPGDQVQVTLERLGPSGVDSTMVDSAPSPESTDEVERLQPAVARAVELVEEAWKNENLIRGNIETRVTVTVPLDSLSRWLAVREALDSLAVVTRYQVVHLMRSEALVDVTVAGDAEQFRVALAQRDLQLLPGAGDYILKARDQPMPAALAPVDPAAGAVPEPAPAPGAPPPVSTTGVRTN